MSTWPSARARQVFAALQRIGWSVKRQTGSHRTLARARMLARIAKRTGLQPDDL